MVFSRGRPCPHSQTYILISTSYTILFPHYVIRWHIVCYCIIMWHILQTMFLPAQAGNAPEGAFAENDVGHPNHCRWLRLAWAHRNSQILTRSFDSYIVSWSFLWLPVVSWCSLFKRERCKLMQDHARKSKILYYIYKVSSLGEGVWDSGGLHGFCPPIVFSLHVCSLPGIAWCEWRWFEKCELDDFRFWTWWCFPEDAHVHTVKLTF